MRYAEINLTNRFEVEETSQKVEQVTGKREECPEDYWLCLSEKKRK